MQRENKFRGQHINTAGGGKPIKEWVYGYLFGVWERRYILWGTTNGRPNMIEVIHETVGQFTGLYDKNGNEIYEGDILRRDSYWDIRISHNEETASFGWSHVDWVVSQGRVSGITKDGMKEYEVIGNIYENPELLEVSE